MIYLRDHEIQRFWKKVKKGEHHECWLWMASLRGWDNKAKYGQFVRSISSIRDMPGPRLYYAHRVAFCISRGYALNYLDDSVAILHQCDQPLCCNPAHLALGTQLENVRDMVRKLRHSHKRKCEPEQEIPV